MTKINLKEFYGTLYIESKDLSRVLDKLEKTLKKDRRVKDFWFEERFGGE